MRAAVLSAYGTRPVVQEFPEPEAGPDRAIVRVLATALNPVDLAIASGGFALRHPQPPFVLGLDGVGQLPDGQPVYFRDVPTPYGSFAERAPVDPAKVLAVPEGLDPTIAAAIGVPGLAAWLALEFRARLAPGETVLVLGAGGAVGELAVQIARLLGAGRTVAAARSDASLVRVRRLGADATVQLSSGPDLPEKLRHAAPDGYDVIVDLAWGDAIQPAIDAANVGARVVQVGNLAGADARINAPSFRNKLVSILGHTNFLTPPEVVRAAYTRLAERARDAEIQMECESVLLDRFSDAWERLQARTSRKQVVVPS